MTVRVRESRGDWNIALAHRGSAQARLLTDRAPNQRTGFQAQLPAWILNPYNLELLGNFPKPPLPTRKVLDALTMAFGRPWEHRAEDDQTLTLKVWGLAEIRKLVHSGAMECKQTGTHGDNGRFGAGEGQREKANGDEKRE